MDSLKYKIADSLMKSKNNYIIDELDFKEYYDYIYLPSVLKKFQIYSLIQSLTLIWLASPLAKQAMNELLSNLLIHNIDKQRNLTFIFLREMIKHKKIKKEVNVSIFDEFSNLIKDFGLTIIYDEKLKDSFFLTENNYSFNWIISINNETITDEKFKKLKYLFEHYLFPSTSIIKNNKTIQSQLKFDGITINLYIPEEIYKIVMKG